MVDKNILIKSIGDARRCSRTGHLLCAGDSYRFKQSITPSNRARIDANDPFELFGFFFTNEIMDELVAWTNEHSKDSIGL